MQDHIVLRTRIYTDAYEKTCADIRLNSRNVDFCRSCVLAILRVYEKLSIKMFPDMFIVLWLKNAP